MIVLYYHHGCEDPLEFGIIFVGRSVRTVGMLDHFEVLKHLEDQRLVDVCLRKMCEEMQRCDR